MRSDYKLKRNKKIYEAYVSQGLSFNQLAKEYKLTPQRINYIVNDFKDKALTSSLDVNAPKQEREDYKNLAINIRENGRHELAADMFDEILAWDKENQNLGGQIDVLGHKRIALSLAAKNQTNKKQRSTKLEQASDCAKQAVKLIKTTNDEKTKGRLAIASVHLASALLQVAENGTEQEKLDKALKDGLKSINEAIENLPGSQAHKAWPTYTKAKILIKLNRVDEAQETVTKAFKWLDQGYEDEMKDKDQGPIKLRVWQSGLALAMAQIYIKKDKPILAEIHLGSVIGTPDPNGILKARKDEAKQMLKQIQTN